MRIIASMSKEEIKERAESIMFDIQCYHTPYPTLGECEILMEANNNGSLWLHNLEEGMLEELPAGLTVGGSLYLSRTPIEKLPEGLTVGGYLNLSDTQIEKLPEGLTVGGYLNLGYTQITKLPEGLAVGGSLYLGNTQIEKLPEGLTVGGLYLKDAQIKELPEGLVVGGWLSLKGSKVTSLPEDVRIGGGIDIRRKKIREQWKANKATMQLKDGEIIQGKYRYKAIYSWLEPLT